MFKNRTEESLYCLARGERGSIVEQCMGSTCLVRERILCVNFICERPECVGKSRYMARGLELDDL